MRLVKDSNGRHEIIKQGGERINDDTTHFRHDGCLLHLATFQRMGHVCEYEISRNSTIKEILRYKENKGKERQEHNTVIIILLEKGKMFCSCRN